MASNKTGINRYFELGFLTSDLILQNLTFVLFLGFMAIIYIANARFAEKNLREIQHLQQDIRELRWRYMTIESENMYNARQSEMADRLDGRGMEAYRTQPKRIVVEKKKDY